LTNALSFANKDLTGNRQLAKRDGPVLERHQRLDAEDEGNALDEKRVLVLVLALEPLHRLDYTEFRVRNEDDQGIGVLSCVEVFSWSVKRPRWYKNADTT
jgi:hypothetical protein